MSEQLGFVFLALFVVSAAACVYLSTAMSRRIQTAINASRIYGTTDNCVSFSRPKARTNFGGSGAPPTWDTDYQLEGAGNGSRFVLGQLFLGDESFAAATAFAPRSLCAAPPMRTNCLGAWISAYSRSPSVMGTIASFSPCTTNTGAVTLPAHKSERNRSFMSSRTGMNQ